MICANPKCGKEFTSTPHGKSTKIYCCEGCRTRHKNKRRQTYHREYSNAWRKQPTGMIREREYYKRYIEKHHDRKLEKQRADYSKFKSKRIQSSREWQVNNPDQVRRVRLSGINNLATWYVKASLRKKGVVNPSQNLIDLNRSNIKLKRKIYETKQTIEVTGRC